MHIGTRERSILKRAYARSDTHYGQSGFIQKFAEAGPRPTKICQWIEGQPTKMDYRRFGTDPFKCGAPSGEESPYCEHHHKLSHRVLTEEKESAASDE